MTGTVFVRWLYSLALTTQFLTRIPILFLPDWVYEDAGIRSGALALFPVIGAGVGAFGWLFVAFGRAVHLPDLASAILGVGATACVTGALHEDGLADVFDALGPHTRERALEAMRDSRVGTFGAAALWGCLTLKAIALAALPPDTILQAMMAAHILSRWSSLPMVLALPSARAGLAATVAESLSLRAVAGATVFTVVAAFFLLGMTPSLWTAMIICGLVLISGAFYMRRFGGITGDCLGATNQLVEAATLLVAAAAFPQRSLL